MIESNETSCLQMCDVVIILLLAYYYLIFFHRNSKRKNAKGKICCKIKSAKLRSTLTWDMLSQSLESAKFSNL